MPSERSCSSLARRAASSSSLTGSLHPDGDLGDLELALLAVGQDDLGGVALLVAHEGLAHGRLVRQPLGRAGLGRADDDEGLLLALVVLDVDLRADAHDVGAELARVEHARAAQPFLELRDARLEHGLLVLGVVVLGVLRDVAELPGLLDPLGDLPALGALEVLQLVLEVLEPFFGEDDVLLHVDRRTPGWFRGLRLARIAARVRRPPAQAISPREPARPYRSPGARPEAPFRRRGARRTRGRPCASSALPAPARGAPRPGPSASRARRGSPRAWAGCCVRRAAPRRATGSRATRGRA